MITRATAQIATAAIVTGMAVSGCGDSSVPSAHAKAIFDNAGANLFERHNGFDIVHNAPRRHGPQPRK